jgi:hypothetical protein
MTKVDLQLVAKANLVLGAAIAILCALQLARTNQLQQQAMEVARHNVKRQALVTLLAESMQYGQKNPAILPVLSAAGLNVVPAGGGDGNTRGSTGTPVVPRSPSRPAQ